MTNQPTYLFYDIETTGLNKCFDQVLQFAAIRTDLELNEIDRIEIQAMLNVDVIPAPAAVITHRIGPDQFTQGITEYEAIQQIHKLLNEKNTISVGYNTLGFDDEFLRFSFYKNLLPPYTHQYANNCGRMDIYPITVMYHLFKPGILNWPKKPDGNVSLKLEDLNTANHLATGQAHNAMVDVEATVALAKRLAADKSMWHYTTQYFKKQTDEQRITECDTSTYIGNRAFKTGLMVLGRFGAKSNFIAPVIQCGQHLHYKNQSVWLRLDQDEMDTTQFPVKKRLAEPPIFLPLKARYLPLLSDDRRATMEKNLTLLSKNPDLFSTISQHHRHEKYPDVPGVDVDAALYTMPFPTQKESQAHRAFHAAKPSEKKEIIQLFQNPIREKQAMRIMARHFPDQLNAAELEAFQAYCDEQTIDFRGEEKLSKAKAIDEIKSLNNREDLDAMQVTLLESLGSYFK